MGDRRGAYRILVGRPEGKRLLGRLSVDGSIMLIWMNKKWDGSMDWIKVAQDRHKWRAALNAIMNLRVPRNAGNFLTSRRTASFSRRTLLHGAS
jgi:hypothetical protein